MVGLLFLSAFGMAVNGFGIAIASRMKSFEGFGAIVNFVVQPIFFLSGALYPLDGLPKALKVVVLANPMSYAVDAVRGLALGVHHFAFATDFAVIAAATAAAGWFAARSFARMQA